MIEDRKEEETEGDQPGKGGTHGKGVPWKGVPSWYENLSASLFSPNRVGSVPVVHLGSL